MKHYTVICLYNLVLIIAFTSGEILNLKCVSSRSERGCLCKLETDTVTSLITREVSCKYLNLQDFPNITEQTLNSLDLSHNQLKALEKHYFLPQQEELMLKLILSYNSITKIQDDFFDNFLNLIKLDLSHNEISHLTSNLLFDKLEHLEVLDISFNKIVSLSNGMFQNLKNLQSLNLSYNSMYEILQDPTALTDKLGITSNIKKLSLNNVGVTKIHTKCWNSFEKLEYLSVADNPLLTDIPQTQTSLKRLDISGTNITEFAENYLKYPNLEYLKMARMENLTFLPHYALYNLGNLEELILTDSHKLDDFNDMIFGPMDKQNYPRKMKRLDLSRNNLKSLNDSFRFLLKEMVRVDLGFNPWHCDCNLLWLDETDISLHHKSHMRCGSPDDLVNKLMYELHPEDIPNCYTEIYGKKSHQTALLLLSMVVLALIVVIIYLCLYSPSWSIKISRSKMAPDSPYSINDEQI